MHPDLVSDAATAEPGFLGDLRSSVAFWSASPGVPLAVAATALAGAVPLLTSGALAGALYLLTIPVTLFGLGLRGASRLWYVRLADGQPATAREMWRWSWRLLGRLIRLGLLVLVPFAVGYAVLHGLLAAAGVSGNARVLVSLTIASLAVDVVLTFVVPALVLTRPTVRAAFSVGWRMLLAHWRHALAYVVTPPLALQVLARLAFATTSGGIVCVLLQPPLALLDLAFKGAITFYYVRHAPAATTSPQPAEANAAQHAVRGEVPAEPPRPIIVLPVSENRWYRGKHH